MTRPSTILLVEDDPSDVLLIQRGPWRSTRRSSSLRRVDELRPYLSEKPELS